AGAGRAGMVALRPTRWCKVRTPGCWRGAPAENAAPPIVRAHPSGWPLPHPAALDAAPPAGAVPGRRVADDPVEAAATQAYLRAVTVTGGRVHAERASPYFLSSLPSARRSFPARRAAADTLPADSASSASR